MGQFQTTRWSLIATAARESPSLAREALEQLCRAYRPPVVAYLRRDGHAPADAEDLAQAFFVRFIERGWYRDADPERGRFRSLNDLDRVSGIGPRTIERLRDKITVE